MAEQPDPLGAELRALQARAYGPDADIHSDPAALARLLELERASATRPGGRDDDPGGEGNLPPRGRSDAGGGEEGDAPGLRGAGRTSLVPGPGRAGGGSVRRPLRRWAIAGAAAGLSVAIAVAATVAVAPSDPPAPPDDGAAATPRASINETEFASRMSAYLHYIEGKRDEVLDLPGAEAVAARMVRSDFHPYGTLYGRLVGTGRTVDDRVCMIVEDLPAARVLCLSTPWALPVTAVFPLADSAAFSHGEPAYIGYTLSADGTVVATPGIDPSDVSSPEPERTAVPAPGTR